ncbi:MAG: hypothetical protein SPJ83_02775 [Helicobacter sp.]|uniref:hypothetical protein n=1 Tax=Helicobacter sp. TaxID=218 RepID=UPI002A91CEB6|nr:hypothetical protein [Helicobacter sp.]MDY5821712.1 hypothetical protein [Helicobacter sp.]
MYQQIESSKNRAKMQDTKAKLQALINLQNPKYHHRGAKNGFQNPIYIKSIYKQDSKRLSYF